MISHSQDEMSNAQWPGHPLKQLQLTDNAQRQHYVGGKLYAIERSEVLDMMKRYEVPPIEVERLK